MRLASCQAYWSCYSSCRFSSLSFIFEKFALGWFAIYIFFDLTNRSIEFSPAYGFSEMFDQNDWWSVYSHVRNVYLCYVVMKLGMWQYLWPIYFPWVFHPALCLNIPDLPWKKVLVWLRTSVRWTRKPRIWSQALLGGRCHKGGWCHVTNL